MVAPILEAILAVPAQVVAVPFVDKAVVGAAVEPALVELIVIGVFAAIVLVLVRATCPVTTAPLLNDESVQ
jgi:hypothetical protein